MDELSGFLISGQCLNNIRYGGIHMDTMMDIILKRRSIRKYSETPIEPEKIDTLLKAAMQAPSSGNQRPWEFIVVQDKEQLEKLSHMSPYSKMLAHATLAIVFLGNTERMRYPENWEEDMSMAAQNLLLEAVDLNLGAVFLTIIPHEDRIAHVNNLFELPDHIKPFSVISIGYPSENHDNKVVDRYDAERIHYERL